jgi:hypothetical protein
MELKLDMEPQLGLLLRFIYSTAQIECTSNLQPETKIEVILHSWLSWKTVWIFENTIGQQTSWWLSAEEAPIVVLPFSFLFGLKASVGFSLRYTWLCPLGLISTPKKQFDTQSIPTSADEFNFHVRDCHASWCLELSLPKQTQCLPSGNRNLSGGHTNQTCKKLKPYCKVGHTISGAAWS